MRPLLPVLGAALCLASEPVTPWAMSLDRNLASAATGLPVHLDDTTRSWRVEMGTGFAVGAPTIVGEVVIAGMSTKNTLVNPLPAHPDGANVAVGCWNRADGTLRWTAGMTSAGYGLCTAPVVDGNRVFLASRGVSCFDLNGQADGDQGLPDAPGSTADLLWHVPLPGRAHDAFSGTPLLVDGKLWVPTCHAITVYSGDAFAMKQEYPWRPNVVVLDPADGRLLAHDDLVIPEVFHGQWASCSTAVVNGRRLVFWPDGFGVVHAFATPTTWPQAGQPPVRLEPVWQHDANPPDFRTRGYYDKLEVNSPVGKPSEIIATPVVADGRVYVGIGRDYMYSEKKGERRYCPGAFWCLDAATGAPRWSYHGPTVQVTLTSASVADGLVYFADIAGTVHCLDAVSGAVVWTQDVGATVWSASPVLADGKLYVTTCMRRLFTLAAGRTPAVLAESTLDAPDGATPAATHGQLIVLTGRSISAFGGLQETRK